MTFEEIRKTVTEDYNKLEVSASVGQRSMKAFYTTFAKALEELYHAVGPFTTSKEDFISQVEYKKNTVSKDVYQAMIGYCNMNLGMDLSMR